MALHTPFRRSPRLPALAGALLCATGLAMASGDSPPAARVAEPAKSAEAGVPAGKAAATKSSGDKTPDAGVTAARSSEAGDSAEPSTVNRSPRYGTGYEARRGAGGGARGGGRGGR